MLLLIFTVLACKPQFLNTPCQELQFNSTTVRKISSRPPCVLQMLKHPGPALAHKQPHSNEHGSLKGELISHLSHTHPMFRVDNEMVYDHLEVATRSTINTASIKPFLRTKNGRAAYQALISQHAGEDKWEKELKLQQSFMKSRVWKGNSNFSFEKFIEQHRAAYISMQQCSLHVTFQLPYEHTRVRYLLDAIQCSDPELQATLAAFVRIRHAQMLSVITLRIVLYFCYLRILFQRNVKPTMMAVVV